MYIMSSKKGGLMEEKGLIMGIALFFIFSLCGCDNFSFTKKSAQRTKKSATTTPVVTGTIIAKVNNYPITLEELNKEVKRYNETVLKDKPEMKINTPEKKIAYLKDEMVRRILIYQEALDRGLDRNPDVRKALEQTKQQLLIYKLIENETNKISVTSGDIEDYYNRYKDSLREPEQRRIREIVVISESQAKDLLIRLLQGEDFASLARQYSKAKSADKGGDLGFIKPEGKFKEFREIAFSDALGVGSISSVFRGPDGYYIIKIEAIKGGQQKSLSEMWDDIKRGLTFLKQQERVNELVGNLSRKAKIEIMEDKVK